MKITNRNIQAQKRIADCKEQVWQNICKQTGYAATPNTVRLNFGKHVRTISGVAAAVVVLLAIGFAISINTPQYQRYLAQSEREQITLPDGTEVTLAQGAEIAYLVDDSQRLVNFDGVAHFAVAKDSIRPFRISAGDESVEVLGTKFTLYNTPLSHSIEVNEGHVAYSTNGFFSSNQVELFAGEGARLSPDGQIDKNALSSGHDWLSCYLKLDGQTLAEAIPLIQKVYPQLKSVTEQPEGIISSIADIKVTTQFKDTPLDKVLNELGLHYGVQLRFENGVLNVSK